MSNLEEKFEAFEAQSAVQHTALMGAVADTNAKLDALIALWGGAPPTATVSLADVLAAIQDTNAALADVHTDTMSMDGKLLTIRDDLADVHLDTQSIDGKLLIIRDTTSNIYDFLTVPDSFVSQIQAALGTPSGDATTTALGLLSSVAYSNANISAVTGSPSLDLLSQVEYLSQIQACVCADPNAIPSLTDCTAPFTSTGIVLTPFSFVGFADVAVAVWTGPLPAGMSFGSTFGVEEDHTSLYRDDWAGWRVYVQSSEFNAAYVPTSADRYPTNTWQAFPSGPGEYSFAVRGQGSIRVVLCPTGIAGPVNCVEHTVYGLDDNSHFDSYTITTPVFVQWVSGAASFVQAINCYLDGVYLGALSAGNPQMGPIGAGTLLLGLGNQHGTCTYRLCDSGFGD